MVMLDANAVIRYVLDDISEQADAAEAAINNGACVPPLVLAECVYILTKFYKQSRGDVAVALLRVLECVETDDADVMRASLLLFASEPLDFADCVLLAYNRVRGMQILTFDKRLLNRLALS